MTLTSSLPAVIAESIRQDGMEAVDGLALVKRSVAVDLFEMSVVPKHAAEAHALQETGMSLSKIGVALGITKRLAGLAAKLGAVMKPRGPANPFVRLADRPEKVSRWTQKRGHGDDGVRDQFREGRSSAHRMCGTR